MQSDFSSTSGAIVVTGASTGIGYFIAKKFIEKGFLVFGSVRKPADAEHLRAEFGDKILPLLFDVTDSKAVREAAQLVKEKLDGKGLEGLINNAGIAQGGPILYMDMDLVKKHFEVNVFGVIEVIRAFAPLLGATENYRHKPGKIINISSSSGKISSPFVAPYVGSKFALEGMSGSMRREFMKFGIDVIVVGPGVVKTPIWDKAGRMEEYEHTPYRNSLEKFRELMPKRIAKGLEPEVIAEKVYKVFMAKNPKTRYAVAPNPFVNFTLPRSLPPRLLDRIFAKMLLLGRK